MTEPTLPRGVDPRTRATFGEWTAGTPTALCDDDKCPWKHRGVSLGGTEHRSREHVEKTGHNVTIYWEQRRTVFADA